MYNQDIQGITWNTMPTKRVIHILPIYEALSSFWVLFLQRKKSCFLVMWLQIKLGFQICMWSSFIFSIYFFIHCSQNDLHIAIICRKFLHFFSSLSKYFLYVSANNVIKILLKIITCIHEQVIHNKHHNVNLIYRRPSDKIKYSSLINLHPVHWYK